MQFSMSTEVLSVTDGLATVKIGLFFDGKLYNNEYFTKSGLAEACLTRFVKWYGPQSSDIKSIRNNDITLENAKEKDYTYWSFRDVNISDYTFEGSLQNKKPTYTESLDKTIFNAKVLLSDAGSFGKLYIGGSVDEDSAERGLALRGNSKTDEINVVFIGEDGTFYDENGAMSSAGPFLYCRPEIAGVTLRGNSDLQISVSFTIVEKDAETGLVSVEIGIFFNGKLYNNEYYTLKDIDPAYLTRNINWLSGDSGATNSAASLGKAKNVALADNGGSVLISHRDTYSEYIGYGVDTLIDGVVGQNDPYYLGVTGTDLQNEETTVEFTFDDTYIVDHIQMYKKFGADGFPTAFTVDAYTQDGWKTVATETDYASITGWNEITFTDTECSAIRINVTENGKEKDAETYGLHLTEVQIWGAETLANVEAPQQMSEEAVALSFSINEDAINDGNLEGNQGLRVVADTQTENVALQMMFDTALTASYC